MRNKNKFGLIGSLILSVCMFGLMFTSCDNPSGSGSGSGADEEYTVTIKAGKHVTGDTLTATVKPGESLAGKFKLADLQKFKAEDCYAIEGVKKEGESTVTAITDILTTLDALTVTKDLTYEVTAKRTHYKVTINRGDNIESFNQAPGIISNLQGLGVILNEGSLPPGSGYDFITIKFKSDNSESLSDKLTEPQLKGLCKYTSGYEYKGLFDENGNPIDFSKNIKKDATYIVKAKEVGKHTITINLTNGYYKVNKIPVTLTMKFNQTSTIITELILPNEIAGIKLNMNKERTSLSFEIQNKSTIPNELVTVLNGLGKYIKVSTQPATLTWIYGGLSDKTNWTPATSSSFTPITLNSTDKIIEDKTYTAFPKFN